MAKKVAVTKIRDFRPHADHLHGARVFQKLAAAEVDGSYYQRVACLAFCAFALEAYFNHLGRLTLSNWGKVEFRSPLAKLHLLAAEFRVELVARRRPLLTVIELFEYRNWLAHTRSETITEETEHPHDTYEERFMTSRCIDGSPLLRYRIWRERSKMPKL